MTIKTAVGAADDEPREPDPIGTVRTQYGALYEGEDFYAVWVKVGRALISGLPTGRVIHVHQEWLCIESSSTHSHGKRVTDDDVKDFPVTGAVPNTKAHAQRQIGAARKYVKGPRDYAEVAGRLRNIVKNPKRAITPSLHNKRRKKGES